MKKEITLFLVVLMFLTITSSVIAEVDTTTDNSKCMDTDRGINYIDFGTASYTYNGNYYEADDGCVLIEPCDTCGPYKTKITSVDSCSGEECYLAEVYCYSTYNLGADKSQRCSQGCDKGLCKEIDILSSTETPIISDSVDSSSGGVPHSNAITLNTVDGGSTGVGIYVKCVPNEVLMKKMNLLLDEVDEIDEDETSEAYHEKIKTLKEEITIDLERCNNNIQLTRPEVAIEEGEIDNNVEWARRTDTQTIRSSRGTIAKVDACGNLEKLKEKYAHYEKLSKMNNKELSEKGWENKERIMEILKELGEYKKKAMSECEGLLDEGEEEESNEEGQEAELDEYNSEIPIAPESGNEITYYYKNKITDVMSDDTNSGDKITALKQLKKEIDILIEDLIRSQEDIDSNEISELVEKIEIKPGKISADDITVETTKKSILKKINNKEIRIIPSEKYVILEDEFNGQILEIKTEKITIENDELKIGDSKVNIMASDILERLKIKPNKIELKEKNEKAVYEIETEETGKLFAFIPIKFNEKLTVNAGDSEGKVIKDSSSALGFLITKD